MIDNNFHIVNLGEKHLAPIIKVVRTTCNLRCPYCFYEGSQSSRLEVMDEQVLEIILKRFFDMPSKNVQFFWHGGEPLLAGIPFYEKIIQTQKSLSQQHIIKNSLQTNGTLIDSTWAKFFKENHFGVGVSLDGPQHIHDLVRVNANGNGSFKQVMDGISTLRQEGMETGVIAVINSNSVKYPKELFSFFYKNRLSFSANDCVSGESEPQSVKELAVNPRDYAVFLLEILDLWLETGDTNFKVKPLEDFIHGVMGQKPQLCKFSGSCYRYITVDINGDIYPCHEYLNQQFLLGNLVEMPLGEIIKSSRYQQYYAGRGETKLTCGQCKWLQVCQGWCMRSWNGKNAINDLSEHQTCEMLQYLFEEISQKLRKFGYKTIN